MSFSDLVSMQAAQTYTFQWRRSSIDSEFAALFGHLAAAVNPSATPGQQYIQDDNGIGAIYDTGSVGKWLVRVDATADANAAGGCFWIVDRLVGVGNNELTATGIKTVNSTSLPRYTTGAGVQVFLEASVATGATTAPIINLNSYTNQNGDTGRTGGSFVWASTSMDIGTILGPMPLQAGDTGVRSVESVNVTAASSGTTAKFNVFLVKPLMMLESLDGGSASQEHHMPIPYIHQMERIYDGASFDCFLFGYSGSEPTFGSITVVLDG